MCLVWKSGHIYEYDYSGFLSTGMMGVGPKISGGSLSGRLVIQPVDEHTINIAVSIFKCYKCKLFNVQYILIYIHYYTL